MLFRSHTRLRINAIIAGIIVMTAVYTVDLRVMGRANTPLLSTASVFGDIVAAANALGVPAREGVVANILILAAFVAVGVSSGVFADADRLHVPVLDIYGAQDFPQVIANADARARAIARLKGSAQIEVPAADHYFTGRETELAQRVRQFLDRTLR